MRVKFCVQCNGEMILQPSKGTFYCGACGLPEQINDELVKEIEDKQAEEDANPSEPTTDFKPKTKKKGRSIPAA